jgi:ATP-binding cassette subfamily B protein
MDCGPAALTAFLAGHGLTVSYGRLREACQTGVDGTSIDMLEIVAVQRGLNAEQILVPVDHLFLPDTAALPALVVVQQPGGATHFVVAWRRHGRLVQVMDPGTGRRWPTCRRFLDDLYVHTQAFPAAAWRAWAETDTFLGGLRRRWAALGIARAEAERLLAEALADPAWMPLAALDATTRMLTALVCGGGLRRGQQATRALATLFARASQDEPTQTSAVPVAYWTVRPAPPAADGTPSVLVCGAVLVRVCEQQVSSSHPVVDDPAAAPEAPPQLPPDLVAALEEPPSRPGRHLLRLLRADGLLAPITLGLSMGLAAGGVLVEALLWQGLIDLTRHLGAVEQRLGALVALLVFVTALLLLDLVSELGLGRLGRRLEARLRLALLAKIPRLGDRYFQSRPTSDMAARSHSLHHLRLLPDLGGQSIRVVAELVCTAAGLVWLAPSQALLVVLAVLGIPALLLAMQPLLTERDLRVRTHAGALAGVSLDALLGLTAVRAHGAERAMQRAYASLLVEWTRAGLHMQRAVVSVEGVQGLLGLGFTAGLLAAYLAHGGEVSGALLLTYWALRIPALGQELMLLAQHYAGQRNTTLRLLEPLGAPEEGDPEAAAGAWEPTSAAAGAAGNSVQHKVCARGIFPLPPLWGKVGMGGRSAAGALQRPSPPPSPSPIKGEGTHVHPHGKMRAENYWAVGQGVAIALEGVSVVAGGHTILTDLTLTLAPGSHVAIVGPSGAGKSSLVGLLLGWHRPASGRVLVEGRPLDEAHLAWVRQVTAWVDPAVQLWNRPLLDNLCYGAADTSPSLVAQALAQADLRGVLDRLPDGLQTPLGEGGGLVSGGEGQRVRLGRALARRGVRLVILDEPFRGLDREQRGVLLQRARQEWRAATLLCITHDVQSTQAFDRVLVVEAGRIIEDDAPACLAARPETRYRALLDAEVAVHAGLWCSARWRRLHLVAGRVHEEARPGSTTGAGGG